MKKNERKKRPQQQEKKSIFKTKRDIKKREDTYRFNRLKWLKQPATTTTTTRTTVAEDWCLSEIKSPFAFGISSNNSFRNTSSDSNSIKSYYYYYFCCCCCCFRYCFCFCLKRFKDFTTNMRAAPIEKSWKIVGLKKASITTTKATAIKNSTISNIYNA